MNLRELWDTVVLRDILGYIFPGCVTLLAVALLLTDCELLAVWGSLDVCRNQGILGLLRLPVDQPRMLLLIAPAAYVIGHLQAWIIALLEKRVPSWNLGHLALRSLHEKDLGQEYAMAALVRLRHMGRQQAKRQPLLVWLSSSNHACTEQGEQAEREAEDLWRVCDRYVLHQSANTHAMFMGRYYILAVLFSNLGLSLVVLGLPVWASWVASGGLAAAAVKVLVLALVLLVTPGIALGIPWPQRHDGGESWATVAKWSVFGVGVTAAIGVCLGSADRAAALVAAASGVLLIWRSGYFRMRFVECTFPIFYAIVQAEESPKPAQA